MKIESYRTYQGKLEKEVLIYCLLEDNNGDLYIEKDGEVSGSIIYQREGLTIFHEEVSNDDKRIKNLKPINSSRWLETLGDPMIYGISKSVIGNANLQENPSWKSEGINLKPYSEIIVESAFESENTVVTLVFDEIIMMSISNKERKTFDVKEYNSGVLKVFFKGKEENVEPDSIIIRGKRGEQSEAK